MAVIRYYELAYEDIEQISRMEQAFFSIPWSEASIAHYAQAGNTVFVVARSEEPYIPEKDCPETAGGRPRRVVGYAAVFCAADEGNLVSIGVDPDYREMGIGRELLDLSCEMAMDRGITSINLEVRESNTPAIALYEQEGFVCTGKRPSFYRNPTEDALLYIRQLPAVEKES